MVVHISTDDVLYGLQFITHVGNIGAEGVMSQIFYLGLTFLLCQKMGNFLNYTYVS